MKLQKSWKWKWKRKWYCKKSSSLPVVWTVVGVSGWRNLSTQDRKDHGSCASYIAYRKTGSIGNSYYTGSVTRNDVSLSRRRCSQILTEQTRFVTRIVGLDAKRERTRADRWKRYRGQERFTRFFIVNAMIVNQICK